MATESLCPPKQTLLIGHHCLIKMMASAKSSICSKITSVRMREKKSESKKSLPRAEVFCNHRCARVKYSGKGERGTPTISKPLWSFKNIKKNIYIQMLFLNIIRVDFNNPFFWYTFSRNFHGTVCFKLHGMTKHFTHNSGLSFLL